jgi:hypothetical protein
LHLPHAGCKIRSWLYVETRVINFAWTGEFWICSLYKDKKCTKTRKNILLALEFFPSPVLPPLNSRSGFYNWTQIRTPSIGRGKRTQYTTTAFHCVFGTGRERKGNRFDISESRVFCFDALRGCGGYFASGSGTYSFEGNLYKTSLDRTSRLDGV